MGGGGAVPQFQHMGQGAQQVPQIHNQYYNQQSQAQQGRINQLANSNNGMGHFQVPMNNQPQTQGGGHQPHYNF